MLDDSLPLWVSANKYFMITFLENKKSVGCHLWKYKSLWSTLPEIKNYKKPVACFLIEMKFISKLRCCLILKNVSFPIPHLRKIIFERYTQTIYIKTNFQTNGGYTFRKCSKILIIRYGKIICFQDVPIYFLIFVEVFW